MRSAFQADWTHRISGTAATQQGKVMYQLPSSAQQHSGFSLLEVMIAMLVLAIGASGLALLLLASVQGTLQAQERSMAVLQASELAQLIHANPAVLGHFMFPVGNVEDCSPGSSCSSDEWAASHLQQWQQDLHRSLAEVQGVVCQDSSPLDGDSSDLACDGSGVPLVKIAWEEQSRDQQGQQTQRLVMPLPQL